MASKNKRFVNHPGCRKAPKEALEYRHEEDKNPPLNGWPLVIASAIVPRIPGLYKLLWNNAKFGQVRSAPGLQGVAPRFQPNVIPLAEHPGSVSMIPFGPEFYSQQPADLAGRFYSAADYHALYRSGKVTPLQVVEAVFRSLGDKSSDHRHGTAWIGFDSQHRERVIAAAVLSTERWAQGKPLGIMDGVPFGVKADVDVHLYVSTMGMRVDMSKEYFKKHAEGTCWPVAKLVEAGGIFVGKMNQHEIGMDTTGCNVQPSTGTPINWYNESYYPGGSSSGAGSALCGGVVPIAIGTDAGGSCRIPASFCGVYGLKPTHNRLCDRASSVCVVGPMAATAADLTIAYRIAAQPNPGDPAQNVLAVSTPPEPPSDPANPPPRYIGICREWIEAADPEVRAIFDASLDDLVQRCGYTRVTIHLPYLREAQLAHSAICLTEAVVEAEDRAGSGGVAGVLSKALDMLNAANRMLVGTGAQTPARDYIRYAQLRQVVMAHLGFLFKEHPGLIILTPTTPMAGWPRAEGDQRYGCFDGNRCLRNMTYAWLANMSGCPAVSMPAGYVEPKQGEGMLPVGLMALGEWGEEEQLLSFAREREEYLNHYYPGGRRRPEKWADVIKLAEEREKNGREEAEGVQDASED
ncbi:hypothetical protein VTJ49DRAFT_2419 [Mycothermus thermophilus]|uniref:Amidase domain-containing protein n=1 Tax=Humicola insolens TaxID=85995 RepID=A0ABR3VAT2_HUMIN